ncbi:cytochrome d ubiquinol oxidase subunit II [Actinopolymorpha alba]|uniref:cytochrome d ubiquinol oxidase subunit II n=1 Tax=Actinopolymorpha alba TaxID=533267 RepID=UPI0003664A57|nr:cytochrome d ubiquinol oxidase subunit II [Actinopolymorpha alba]
MTLATVTLAVLWVGLTLYVLLGGADFGGGVWDLIAGGPERGRETRRLVEHSLGPVWEANHVWLIFVVVVLWTSFPPVFASVASTLYIPLTLAALGIIGRGAAFAYRKVTTQLWQQRLFGAVFAFSSVMTPFFLGAAAGGIASGRVPLGIARGNLVTSWWNPTSVVAGLLAVGTAAYLAAVYLTRDAQRGHAEDLAEYFRRRALITGVVVGGLAVVGLLVLYLDERSLFVELTTGRALPLLIVSVVSGVVSLVLLVRRAFLAVRVTAALAVAGLLWGWGVGQYPMLLPGVTVQEASASRTVLAASLGALLGGAILLVPSLWWLFHLSQQPTTVRQSDTAPRGGEPPGGEPPGVEPPD